MDMFLSEIDGGAMAANSRGDIAIDTSLSTTSYTLLFTGNTPLDVLRGKDPERTTFEEVMDVKVSVQNMARMETVGTEKLQPLIDQKLAKSVKLSVKNTGLERVAVYVSYILLDGSEITEEMAVFENGVRV